MGQLQLTSALILTAMFSIALIAFAINFASDNDAPLNIADDPEYSNLYTQNRGNLSNFGDNSSSQYTSILESTIQPGSQTVQSTGPFAVTPTSALGAVKNIVEVGYVKIFGSNSGFSIFLNSLFAFLIFALGLYLYKTLRGFPD